MKKVVFCILFIFLILGSFLIPCFAADYNPDNYQTTIDNLLPNFNKSDRNGWSPSAGVGSYSVSDFVLTFQVNTNENVLYDAAFSQTVSFQSGHSYLAFYYIKSSVRFTPTFYSNGTSWNPSSYSVSTDYILVSSTCTYSSDRTTSFYIGRVGGISNFRGFEISIYNPCLIDITDLSIPVSDLLSDLQSRGLSDQILKEGSNSFFIPGFFNPLIDFYLSFFHLFDWFPEIISTYSAPFVFGVICLSVLIVVFIIVCIIRRCRSS